MSLITHSPFYFQRTVAVGPSLTASTVNTFDTLKHCNASNAAACAQNNAPHTPAASWSGYDFLMVPHSGTHKAIHSPPLDRRGSFWAS